MEVEEGRAGTAAQILVAAAHGKIDVEGRDVDREHGKRVVDIEQQASTRPVRRADDVGQVGRLHAGAATPVEMSPAARAFSSAWIAA